MISDMKTEVITYLQEHFEMSEGQATDLIRHFHAEISMAERWASAPYYPAQNIARLAGRKHKQPCAACEREKSSSL